MVGLSDMGNLDTFSVNAEGVRATCANVVRTPSALTLNEETTYSKGWGVFFLAMISSMLGDLPMAFLIASFTAS